jgi:Mycothiol maleylpyruvate isomerase N-terminal domain
MTAATSMTPPRGTASAGALDLRRAPLADIQAVDFRAPDRDFWADEASLWDRLVATWAGLDAAAWRLAGAAPSDAGGPDWSFLDHVGHLADWQKLAIEYIGRAIESGRWPTDDDYDGGDFDSFNEGRRSIFADVAPSDLKARLAVGRERLLAVGGNVPLGTIRSDEAWGWVYNVLHGHVVDHLRVLEPWAESLRARQAQADPLGPDPTPRVGALAAGQARFWSHAAAIFDQFDDTVRSVPTSRWTGREVTPGWTLADHLGHLGSWFEEASDALDEHRRSGRWADLPAEGIDAWNAARVDRLRGRSADELLERYRAGHLRLETAIRAMSDDDWLDPEGFSWAYEDYHGHVRAPLAMVGPFAARIGWPKA